GSNNRGLSWVTCQRLRENELIGAAQKLDVNACRGPGEIERSPDQKRRGAHVELEQSARLLADRQRLKGLPSARRTQEVVLAHDAREGLHRQIVAFELRKRRRIDVEVFEQDRTPAHAA